MNFAAWMGHSDVVTSLLQARAEVDAKDRVLGQTPMSHAAGHGHSDVVTSLLQAGAEVDAKDLRQRTPMSHAAENGHLNVVQLLLHKGAEVDAKDSFLARTPMSWAAVNGHWDVVKLLVEERGADVNAKDDYGWTALDYARKRAMRTWSRCWRTGRGIIRTMQKQMMRRMNDHSLIIMMGIV
jgi:ankyrin repeat protein